MYDLDRNGAYCFIAATEFFPVGPYSILTYYDLKNMLNTPKLILSSGKQICGLLLVRILCPQTLNIPILPFRSPKSQKVSLPCCRTCANNNNSKYVKCNHTRRYVERCLQFFSQIFLYNFLTVSDPGLVFILPLKLFMPAS